MHFKLPVKSSIAPPLWRCAVQSGELQYRGGAALYNPSHLLFLACLVFNDLGLEATLLKRLAKSHTHQSNPELHALLQYSWCSRYKRFEAETFRVWLALDYPEPNRWAIIMDQQQMHLLLRQWSTQ